MQLDDQQHPDEHFIAGELREWYADVALDYFDEPHGGTEPIPEAARRAAYHVAVCLGHARLFAVELGELDGELPPAMALAALLELNKLLERLIAEAQSLGDRWDACEHPASAGVDMVCSLLEEAFDAWAAWEAINETLLTGVLAACEQKKPGWLDEHEKQRDQCAGLRARLDAALRQQEELLTVALDTNLIENLRGSLTPDHKLLAPWWLQGRLEEVAAWLQSDKGPLALSHEQVQTMRKVSQKSRNRWWLGDGYQPLAAAAAGPATEAASSLLMTCWAGPEGYEAELLVDENMPEDKPVALAFFGPDNQPAKALVGRPVELAGVHGVIDAEGLARFTRQSLRGGASEPELLVGLEKLPWPLIRLVP
ncbi:MAG: hypothetical protein ACP5QA_13810 [Phycisphaerae bacterium]